MIKSEGDEIRDTNIIDANSNVINNRKNGLKLYVKLVRMKEVQNKYIFHTRLKHMKRSRKTEVRKYSISCMVSDQKEKIGG